jgi:hypothetical protein
MSEEEYRAMLGMLEAKHRSAIRDLETLTADGHQESLLTIYRTRCRNLRDEIAALRQQQADEITNTQPSPDPRRELKWWRDLYETKLRDIAERADGRQLPTPEELVEIQNKITALEQQAGVTAEDKLIAAFDRRIDEWIALEQRLDEVFEADRREEAEAIACANKAIQERVAMRRAGLGGVLIIGACIGSGVGVLPAVWPILVAMFLAVLLMWPYLRSR